MSERQQNSGRGNRALLLALILVGLLGLPAGAIDLYTISGTVTDPAGRPLKDVRVASETRETYTDTEGRYSLGFDSPGTYDITASRTDLNTQTKWVDVVTQVGPVDFQPTYRLAGATTPSAFNNDPPKTLTLSATSTAPKESCVTATISSSGAVVDLSYNSTGADGSNRWTASYEVPAGTADGKYQVNFQAKECGAETLLTNVPAVQYIVDSVAPSIDASNIFPLDHGNTVFLSQPLLVKVSDAVSGANPKKITFTLIDETDPANTVTTTHSASSYSSNTGWGKTPAISLTLGHVYRISVTAADYAGNISTSSQAPNSERGGFLVTSITPTSTLVSVPETDCALSAVDPSTGTKTATCTNLPIHLGASDVGGTGTRHDGVLYMEHFVSPDEFEARLTTAGVDTLWSPASTKLGSWDAIRPLQAVVVPMSSSSFNLEIPATDTVLRNSTYSFSVPGTADSVSIFLPETPSVSSLLSCVDPATSSRPCSPDPIRAANGLLLEVANLDGACSKLLNGKAVFTCKSGDLISFTSEAVAVEQDLVEMTNEIISAAESGTDWVLDSSKYPYGRITYATTLDFSDPCGIFTMTQGSVGSLV